MYLLIRELTTLLLFGGAYLHPTMYLLIRLLYAVTKAEKELFTSHYVSINSRYTMRFYPALR